MLPISAHISYNEATKSASAIRLGIANTPDEQELECMRAVAQAVFEPLRAHFGVPIPITSFFRSRELNTAVGGSLSSEHCYGRAIDMDVDGMPGDVTNADLFHYIREHLPFDQLIWEFGNSHQPDWVHVGYRAESHNRKQVLVAQRIGGATKYRQWMPS
jgi:hypothetical protein